VTSSVVVAMIGHRGESSELPRKVSIPEGWRRRLRLRLLRLTRPASYPAARQL
jgi:hypothetical protein